MNFSGFVLQFLPAYPKLKFVVQHLAENVRKRKIEIFPSEALDAILNERVLFVIHDFFQDNPVRRADVYWLRGIL